MEQQVTKSAGLGLAILNRRWAPEILLSLAESGPSRFNRLLALSVITHGISDRVLTERLRELEGYGLVEREVTINPGCAVAIRYLLTNRAMDYIPPLRLLASLR